jgi:hypothetical protein
MGAAGSEIFFFESREIGGILTPRAIRERLALSL